MNCDWFPYGRAPLWILLVAVAAGAGHWLARRPAESPPDLVFAIFAPNHRAMYETAIAAFEKTRGVKVRMNLVHNRVLTSRLQAALQTGADVPDVVELPGASLGFFTRGPIEEVALVDLTDRLHAEGRVSPDGRKPVREVDEPGPDFRVAA